MMFTDEIKRVYRNQALTLREDSIDNLDFYIHAEKIELKDIFNQVFSQKINYQSLTLSSSDSFYKSAVEGELLARVKQIFKTIGNLEYQDIILKDISRLFSKEKSNYIDIDEFIDKLYERIIYGKKYQRKEYYKYYRIIVKKLISWKQEIRKILYLKVAYKILISFLSNKIRVLTNQIIQIPLKFDLQEYLDLVLTFKDACFVDYCRTKHALINIKGFYKNENRLYQVIMPIK
ncbi:MAG TPA: hypothetical protein VIL99_17450 [Ignavibacteria bacterium]